MKRDVVRLVTPGTLTEDSLLSARQNNFLAAFHLVREAVELARVDISTGEVCVAQSSLMQLGPELARLNPKELLLAYAMPATTREICDDLGVVFTELADSSFDSAQGEKRLKAAYGVDSLDSFGAFARPEFGALGAILYYLDLTQ